MKPILFNTEMVKAILDGRKTVTRRAVKPQPRAIYHDGTIYEDDGYYVIAEDQNGELEQIGLPYHPREILYVRETWQFIPCVECGAYLTNQCNFQPVSYEDKYSVSEGCFVYRADYPETERIIWRPSIHMPRETARLFLRVTDVRVERLQEITGQGLIEEGVCTLNELCNGYVSRASEEKSYH